MNFDTTHRAWERSWINGPDESESDLENCTLQELLECAIACLDSWEEIRATCATTRLVIKDELLTRPDPDYTDMEFDSSVGWVVWNDQLARMIPSRQPYGLTAEQTNQLRQAYRDLSGSTDPQITIFPWWLPHVFPHLPHAKCIQLSHRVLREYKDLLLNT